MLASIASIRMVLAVVFHSLPNFLRFIAIPLVWLLFNVAWLFGGDGKRAKFKDIFKMWMDYAVLMYLHR